jgi:hypothetical protein
MTIIENVTPIRRNKLRAQTIAAASASRNYFYVSTANEIVTFNAETLDEVARFPWEGGGLSSPAIGADGRVYALAGDSLYIFKRSAAIAACPSSKGVENGVMDAVVQGCAAAPPASSRHAGN